MNLELKVPPLLVLGIVAFGMWGIAQYSPTINMSLEIRVGGAILFLFLGGLGLLLSILSFLNHKTTADPINPEKTKKLITSDLFRLSRNPIYLSMVLLLLALGFFLGNLVSFLVVPLFVFYIARFQIRPEERALESKFGEVYLNYKSKVRRWI